jgi:hypothetical protein
MEKVVFQIEPAKQQITVDKHVLIEKSLVFEKMFSGRFPIPSVIEIEDIEADIFQLMINCFVGEQVQVESSNVFKLMYAAEKYMFDPLMKNCASYIIKMLAQNQNAVFSILEFSQPFNCPVLKEMCMDTILDDPIKCLQYPEFLEIKEDTLKMILLQPKMNCTVSTLLRATKKWLEIHGCVVGALEDVYKIISERFGIEKAELEAKKFYNMWSFSNNHDNIKKFQTIEENIMLSTNYGGLVNAAPYLHGIVLCVGVYPEFEANPVADNYLSDTITIKISVKGEDAILKKVVRVLKQPRSMLSTIKVNVCDRKFVLNYKKQRNTLLNNQK